MTSYLGGVQLRKPDVTRWSQPLFEAFCAGCWFLFWTEDTLYWVQKPSVYTESTSFRRRLHRADGPAVTSDVEPLYFWHGLLVDERIIMQPETITVAEIQQEPNQELRRVLLERFGFDRYITASGALPIHADETGTLYRCELEGDEPLVMVSVLNSTPEPTGEFKRYQLRVPPDITTARAAIAWTFDMRAKDYRPVIET